MTDLEPNRAPLGRLPDVLLGAALAFLSLIDALRFVFDLSKQTRQDTPALWRALRPRTQLGLAAVFDRAPARWLAPLADAYGLDAGWGRRALAASCDPPHGATWPTTPPERRAEKALWALERFGLDAGRRLAPLLAELWHAGRAPLAQALVERAGPRGRQGVLAAVRGHNGSHLLADVAVPGDLGAMRWIWDLLQSEIKVPYDFADELAAALCIACRGGHLAVARWLADRPGLGQAEDRVVACTLRVAAAAGHINIVKWLVDRFGANRHGQYMQAVEAACAGGHIALVDWLVARFALKGGDMRGTADAAAAAGHVALAERLVRRFGPICWTDPISIFRTTVATGDLTRVRAAATLLSRSTLRAEAQPAVAVACRAGRRPVAEWLAAVYPCATGAMWENFPTLFTEVCRAGHLDVARWLATHPNAFLPRRRHHAGGRSYDALSWAVAAGHLAVARWLYEHTGGMTLDAGTADQAMRDACAVGCRDVLEWALATFDLWPTAEWVAAAGGRPELVEWLGARVVEWFNAHALELEPDDARADIAFAEMCRDGSLAAAQWLAAAYPLAVHRAANSALTHATAHRHFGIVRWLLENFTETMSTPPLLTAACHYGDVAFVEWAVATYGAPLSDDMMAMAYSGGHHRLAEWLAARGVPDLPIKDEVESVSEDESDNDEIEDGDEGNEGDPDDSTDGQSVAAQNADFDEVLADIYGGAP